MSNNLPNPSLQGTRKSGAPLSFNVLPSLRSGRMPGLSRCPFPPLRYGRTRGTRPTARYALYLNFIYISKTRTLAGAEQIAFELPPVDFAAYARAMGAEAHTIRTPQDLIGLDLGAICRRPGPTLLDVYIDPEEVPPMGIRVRVLNAAGR